MTTKTYKLCGSDALASFVKEKKEGKIYVEMLTITGVVWNKIPLKWSKKLLAYTLNAKENKRMLS